jgi:hypothetical protein
VKVANETNPVTRIALAAPADERASERFEGATTDSVAALFDRIASRTTVLH